MPGKQAAVTVDPDAFVYIELGDIKTPDAAGDAAPSLADGSDIHMLTPNLDERPVGWVAQPDDLDIMLVAYLLDLDGPPHVSATPASEPEPHDVPTAVGDEATKPERPAKR